MSQYAKGGYMRPEQPIMVTLDDDECVLDRDLRCQRRDSAHYCERYEIRTMAGLIRESFGPCNHRHREPVESVVDGQILAYLCPHCDQQLPA